MSLPVAGPGRPGRPGKRPAGSPGASGSSGPTPGTQRLPARRNARRNTQVRRNAVVLGWIVTAAVLAVLVVGGPLAAWGTWLPLHALLLGGIGSAITVWSAHFADTLLHRPALGGAALLDARLYAHGVGTALVLLGITSGRQPIALIGVTVVVLAAVAGVVAIGVQYRRAVAPRLAALAIHYAVALLLLAVGATLGYLTSWAQEKGTTRLADVLYVAHTTTMILGFVGTTVLGTLTVLWPTMLRTKMEPEAPRWTTRGLPLLVTGTVLVACSGLSQPLAVVGMLVYLGGACGVLVPGFRTALRVPPTSFATASAAAAVLWFLLGVVWIGTGIGVAGTGVAGAALRVAEARDVIHTVRVPLAAGFALQILAAALSYLTPVMLGGGPAATRATNAILDRAAAYRVVAANTCLALAVLTNLPWEVRLSAAVVAGAVAGYVPVGMGLCVREIVRRTREKKRAGGSSSGTGGRPAGGPGADGPRQSGAARGGMTAGTPPADPTRTTRAGAPDAASDRPGTAPRPSQNQESSDE